MMASSISVTIKYAKPGTLPPIYVAGSFSDPAWEPQEMEYTLKEDGEHHFHKQVQIQEGNECQYKFRVGDGDWWILDENSPIVIDDIGNQNNLLSVPTIASTKEEMEQKQKISEKPPADEVSSQPSSQQTEAGKAGAELFVAVPHHQHETTQILSAVEPQESIKMTEPGNEDSYFQGIENSKAHNGQKTKADIMTAELDILSSETPSEPHPTPALHVKPSIKPVLEPEVKEIPGAKMEKEISIPTMVVEKVDLEPHHGDDFGPNATIAQKEARLTHALDATPDYVFLRKQSPTPEFVTTASEVADVAAVLDSEPPTPPISDEEAGRIGYRRMSTTPIPEVAATAAEVADTAASLGDTAPPYIIEALPAFDLNKERFIDSGRSTPVHERVPRFSHECGELPNISEPYHREPTAARWEGQSSYEEYSEEVDINDPSIQMFPTERSEILAKLREIQERLPEDETYVEGIPLSPVVAPDHRPFINGQLHTSSPAILAQDRTLSLHSITEEGDHGASLSLIGQPEANGKTELESMSELKKPNTNQADADGGNHNQILSQKQTPSTIKENPFPTTAHTIGGRSYNAEPADQPEERSNLKVLSRREFMMSDGSVDDSIGLKLPEESHSIEIQEVHPESPQDRSSTRQPKPENELDGIALPTSGDPSPVTPFVIGNRQLGQEEDEVQAIDKDLNPIITVMPASPRGSSAKIEKTRTSDDAAKSTAVEDDEQIGARNRKQPIQERSLTPSSIQSAGKEAKDQNILKAFWRVVFVNWIGGLIMRLCGGGRGRRKTFLAVGAIVLFAVAPTLYSSERTRTMAVRFWHQTS